MGANGKMNDLLSTVWHRHHHVYIYLYTYIYLYVLLPIFKLFVICILHQSMIMSIIKWQITHTCWTINIEWNCHSQKINLSFWDHEFKLQSLWCSLFQRMNNRIYTLMVYESQCSKFVLKKSSLPSLMQNTHNQMKRSKCFYLNMVKFHQI